jgi:hyaluronoglucosaminidase
LNLVTVTPLCHIKTLMAKIQAFRRRGVVEGFFGPPWSMAQRKALFAFGAKGGMNTYLYAPKDDPYHRERWTAPYPRKRWHALLQLIRAAGRSKIDFVYGFHPGKGLCFSADEPVKILLAKASRFYAAGVRTFTVLFDDIPSRLEHAVDRRRFKNSLARAEGEWLAKIIAAQPRPWRGVEWWVCPSYYSPDPLLARVFGAFEPDFLENLAEHLPAEVACLWTGPAVVPTKITRAHVLSIAKRIRHPLILWDNYPVNDLSMRDELHIGPLTGRDPRLPRIVYGYLNNPLLQEELSFLPLATCLDYAAKPQLYNPETSWRAGVKRRFGAAAVRHWRAMREFCDAYQRAKKTRRSLRLSPDGRARLRLACDYIARNRKKKWARELKPWQALMAIASR